MEQTGWQRTWVRVLTTVLTLAVMAMIFAFSTQDAQKSDETSGVISKKITLTVYPDYETYEPVRQKAVYDGVQYVVRKCAHFSEYTLLGFLLRLCLESWFGKKLRARNTHESWRGRLKLPALSLFLGAVYAETDELHQMLIDGRSGQWTDVLLDSGGVLFGVLLGTLLILKTERTAKEAEADGVLSKTAAG